MAEGLLPARAAPGRPQRVRAVAAGPRGGGCAGRVALLADRAAGAARSSWAGAIIVKIHGPRQAGRLRSPPGGVARARYPRRRLAAAPDVEPPAYTVPVPAFHEEAAIGGLVRCLGQLDYPEHLLETLSWWTGETSPPSRPSPPVPAGSIRIVEIPPGKPQTKPRSCNAGLCWPKATCSSSTMPRTAPTPANCGSPRPVSPPETIPWPACRPSSWCQRGAEFITRQFALEIACVTSSLCPFARLGMPVPLGGTSNHFRTQVLRDLGGGTPGTSPRTPTWACAAPRWATGSRSSTRSPRASAAPDRPWTSSAPAG